MKLTDYIQTEINQALEGLDRDQIKTDPIIQGFWDLHKAVHLPKRNNTPALRNVTQINFKTWCPRLNQSNRRPL